MSSNLVAKSATSIAAPKDKVWEALVKADAIKQYLFGAVVESDWSKGSPITWTGEMNGKKYEDKGVILEIEPEQTLQYAHFIPSSGEAEKSENHQTISQ